MGVYPSCDSRVPSACNLASRAEGRFNNTAAPEIDTSSSSKREQCLRSKNNDDIRCCLFQLISQRLLDFLDFPFSGYRVSRRVILADIGNIAGFSGKAQQSKQ